MDGKEPLDYGGGKLLLAPMVRVGVLGFRLLALEYGADIVFTEEIIDKRIIQTDRRVNEETGVVEYVANREMDKEDVVVFKTCAEERRVVFQLGSSNPETAVQACRKVVDDVFGFDLNCGCPKRFSVQGGMGSALLEEPDLLCSILTALTSDPIVSQKPVSCKIRLLPQGIDQTVCLCNRLEGTGISALTIHARYPDERPRMPPHWDEAAEVIKRANLHIPVVINGSVFTMDDVERARRITGADSCMIARGALWNMSVFRKDGPLPIAEVARRLIENCEKYHEKFNYLKFCIVKMLEPYRKTSWHYGQICRKVCLEDVKRIFSHEKDHYLSSPPCELSLIPMPGAVVMPLRKKPKLSSEGESEAVDQ